MNFLFRQVDIASLVFFRIAFGLLMCLDILNTLFYDHWHKASLASDKFHFYYYGFEWIKAIAEPGMSILLIFLSIVGIFIMLGKWYRWSCGIFAIGFTYLFFLEKAHYLNHAYLVCWLCFIMILLPANRAFSLDVLKRPSIRLKQVPFWSLFLLQFMMGIVYFFGGIAKINSDWLNALPLQIWLKDLSGIPIIGGILAQKWTAYFMSYGGLFLDCFIVFFLINSKTRIWALAAAIFFHCVNIILFNIGIFPFLSLALTLLFFPPDFPRKVIAYLSRKSSLFQNFANYLARPFQQLADTVTTETSIFSKKVISLSILLLCCVHLLLPLRQHLYDTSTAWTEEGHRYAWRMLLRSKKAKGHFVVKNSVTKEKISINPREHLSPKQHRKMLTHPDMILQFAHYLRDKYLAEGWEAVEVYAFIRAGLNGREFQRYINPSVDLAKEEWSFFKSSEWVLPLETED